MLFNRNHYIITLQKRPEKNSLLRKIKWYNTLDVGMVINMDESAYMFWLAGTADVPKSAVWRLLYDYTPQELWRMPKDRFLGLSAPGSKGAGYLKKLFDHRDERAIYKALERLQAKNIWLLTYNESPYPKSLQTIDDPPLLLYGMGRMPPETLPNVAVIGARGGSSYGLAAAKKISEGLASAGFIIVSGLARGIDCQAHKTAIDTVVKKFGEVHAPSATIAVLGCGVDVCYPTDNYGEYQRILRYGCVLSEYPPGTEPAPYMFPQRNRIISGLSLGVVVVEAALKSGTSITVNTALDQGREVFVVPGGIFSKLSEGTNSMIKEGAVPVTSHADVAWYLRREIKSEFLLRALGIDDNDSANETANENETTNETPDCEHNITGTMAKLLKHISMEPMDINVLISLTGAAPQDAMADITQLELQGLIKAVAGQRYVRDMH